MEELRPQLSLTPPPRFHLLSFTLFPPSSFIGPHGPEQRPHCVGWRGPGGRGVGMGGGERAEGRLHNNILGASGCTGGPGCRGPVWLLGTKVLVLLVVFPGKQQRASSVCLQRSYCSFYGYFHLKCLLQGQSGGTERL